MLGFNDTSTFVGHFVSSPREREKRDRRNSRGDEREGLGRKRNRNESEGTEEIKKYSPFTLTCYKDSRLCSTISQYQLDAPVKLAIFKYLQMTFSNSNIFLLFLDIQFKLCLNESSSFSVKNKKNMPFISHLLILTITFSFADGTHTHTHTHTQAHTISSSTNGNNAWHFMWIICHEMFSLILYKISKRN